MSKRLSIPIVLLTIIRLFIIAATVTFINKEKTANNIITFGNIKIQLMQTTINENNEERFVDNNESFNITNYPIVSRIIKVKNLGNHEFFLRISLDMIGIDENNNEFDANNLIKYDVNTEDWIYNDGWYYYKDIVKESEITSNLITRIFFDINNITSNYSNVKFKFNVNAQVVQAENNAKDILNVIGWPKN